MKKLNSKKVNPTKRDYESYYIGKKYMFPTNINFMIRTIVWPYIPLGLKQKPGKPINPEDNLDRISQVIKLKVAALDFLKKSLPPFYCDRAVALVIHQVNNWTLQFSDLNQRSQIVKPIKDWFNNSEHTSLSQSEIELLNLAKLLSGEISNHSTLNPSISSFINKTSSFDWKKESSVYLKYQFFAQRGDGWNFRSFVKFLAKNTEKKEILKRLEELVLETNFLDFSTTDVRQPTKRITSKLILLKIVVMDYLKLVGLDYLKSHDMNPETLETCGNGLNQQLNCLYQTKNLSEIKTRIENDLDLVSVDLLLWDELLNPIDRLLVEMYFV